MATQKDSGPARAIRLAATAAAYVAGAVLFALMIGTTADVVGRAVFDFPLIGMFDLTHFAVLIMVFLGLAYCGYHGGHIVIELLFDRFGPATRKRLVRLINLVGAILFAALAWRALVQSGTVRELDEASQLLEIRKFPFYWLMAAGAGLFALVMLLRVFVPEPEAEIADGTGRDETGPDGEAVKR
jgi:TRAP-type C4-dicarboxylate transport system permease small subunit